MGIGIQVLGVCLFSAFANLIESRILEFNEQIGLVVLFWAFLPLAVVVCLGLALAMNERERNLLGGEQNSPWAVGEGGKFVTWCPS